jgi:hypothetical protein
MSNPHRGEVALVAGGATYTLVYNTNAVCALEEQLGQSLAEIVTGMGRLKVMRAVLWAGLLERHEFGRPEDVGPIMDAAGVPAVVEAVNTAIAAAFPPPEAGAKRKNR